MTEINGDPLLMVYAPDNGKGEEERTGDITLTVCVLWESADW